MAQVKFKHEGEKIQFGGRYPELNASNLTWEKYEWIKTSFPELADKFEVIEEDKKGKAKAE